MSASGVPRVVQWQPWRRDKYNHEKLPLVGHQQNQGLEVTYQLE